MLSRHLIIGLLLASPAFAGQTIKDADKRFASGDWKNALKAYSDVALAGDKQSPLARLRAGLCHAKLKNPSKARAE